MSATAVRLQVDRDFWLESFRDFLALESGHSANTVEAYLRDLRRMGEFATSRGIRDPAQLTRVLLREFVFVLKDLGLSPSSIRRSVSAIRTYYGFLLGEGRVRDDPSDRLESPRRGRVLPETLSVPEVEALLGSAKVEQPLAWRDRALLELAYGAGLRVSELCSLGLTDLLLTENLIRVFGKGSKEGWDPSAGASLVRYRCPSTRCDPSWTGGKARDACFSMPGASRSPGLARGAWLNAQQSAPALPSELLRIRCVTALQPTYWRAGPIFEQCRRCWATP